MIIKDISSLSAIILRHMMGAILLVFTFSDYSGDGSSVNIGTDTMQTPSLLVRVAKGVLDFIVPGAQAADVVTNPGDVYITDITPILFFNDTDDPGLEWGIVGDSNIVGFWNYKASKYIWQYESLSGDIGFADNLVYIDNSTNRVGVGTTTPQRDLHVYSGNPALALEDNVGVTWTLNYNAGSSVFDINWDNGSTNASPFTILLGALPNSFYMQTNGYIGMGTTAPDSALHVVRGDGTTQLLVEETGGFASRIMQRLKNNGPTALYLEDSSVTGGTWSFTMNFNNFVINNVASTGLKIVAGADNTYRVQNKGTGVETMKVQANGNMVIAGLLTTGSSRTIKDNINTVEHSNILSKLDELPVSYWNYKTTNEDDRHVGPMAEDFYDAFGLGTSNKHIAPSDLAGIALAAAKALSDNDKILYEKSEMKDEQINELKLRIRELESRMADLIQVMSTKEASLNTMAAVQ